MSLKADWKRGILVVMIRRVKHDVRSNNDVITESDATFCITPKIIIQKNVVPDF